MSPKARPREEERVGLFYVLALGADRSIRDRSDFQAMNAQIRQLAIRKAIQLTHGLTIQCPTRKKALDTAKQRRDTAGRGCRIASRTMVEIKKCHFLLPLSVFVLEAGCLSLC